MERLRNYHQIWLESLKEGDEVVMISDKPGAAKVTRITKTLIIAGAYRFRKRDGFSPDSSFYHILPPTDKTRRKAKDMVLKKDGIRLSRGIDEHIRYAIKRCKGESLERLVSMEREILAILDEVRKEDETPWLKQ